VNNHVFPENATFVGVKITMVMINREQYLDLKAYTDERNVGLVAVSKTKPVSLLQEAYDLGQRLFGENKPQEMAEKQPYLPGDVEWHFVGHLQRNKVKMIAPFVSLIHSVDSERLLDTINKEAAKLNRVIPVLFQLHISQDESKYGYTYEGLRQQLRDKGPKQYPNVAIRGLMGIATLTDNENQIRQEFRQLREFYEELKAAHFADDPGFSQLSMGMTGDYKLAIAEGSTFIRVGSYIFGERQYATA
jgi:pyridoxal phosphate enzyme (YggS family)